ncbi:hypothetical protein RJ640_025191 [Escallonia rubra]|uniref:Uncharacterized protein n=1 Tax=Escallonia rubra TaxID=112253 RepID=A0AA88RI48_9ASTE|nr:hypothetical protein RJ640_025191 [Escallonia rubra]
MAVLSSLKFVLVSPWISSPTSNFRFSNPKKPLTTLLLLPRCFSSHSLSTTAQTLTSPDPTPLAKWEHFRKKKVVMRVGYVGTDYRALMVKEKSREEGSRAAHRGSNSQRRMVGGVGV